MTGSIILFNKPSIRTLFNDLVTYLLTDVYKYDDTRLLAGNIDDMASQLANKYTLAPINVNFSDREEPFIAMQDANGVPRSLNEAIRQRVEMYAFVVFSFNIDQHTSNFLQFCPQTYEMSKRIKAHVTDTNLQIHYNTGYVKPVLPEGPMNQAITFIKSCIEAIQPTIAALNSDIEEYNASLKQLALERLSERLAIVQKFEEQRNILNNF